MLASGALALACGPSNPFQANELNLLTGDPRKLTEVNERQSSLNLFVSTVPAWAARAKSLRSMLPP